MFGISALRALVRAAAALSVAFSSGCLDRPLCADCEPETTNLFSARVLTGGVDKVDLLFMIDGSSSMADKQELLEKAVPSLLDRFVNPLCVNEEGVTNMEKSRGGQCTNGNAEFPPLKDIHIAVISSNLGSNGADQCDQRTATSAQNGNDKAWLIPRARPELALDSYQGSGFLAWDPSGTRNVPPGTSDAEDLAQDFRNMVDAVGENGCGYEASLESWYRFLIDPDPPERFVVEGSFSTPTGTDTVLLEQRAKFLRPDSLVAVVMLTDENDCSLSRSASAWLMAQRTKLRPDDLGMYFRMPRGTSTCAANPQSPCCRSCLSSETVAPAGCVPVKQDPACARPQLEEHEDPLNLRCFDQKRRFGIDLLEPVEKYVRGLTTPTVLDRTGAERPNPLFVTVPGKAARTNDLIFLAGIVGVPWQSIATPESLTGPGLEYLTAEQLTSRGIWDVILGDPKSGKLPTDPHMIESVAPRSGAHPFVPNGAIAPAEGTHPRADVISGHEQVTQNQDEPQFACIFELETKRECPKGSNVQCDCKDAPQSPLCRPPLGGPPGTTQYFAKAYPGLRQLEVLKGVGKQGVVASVCPKVPRSANPNTDTSYGYNPALDALVGTIASKLANKCLARAPAVDDSGKLRCVVVEAQVDGSCDCTLPGRSPARPEVLRVLENDLAEDRVCGAPGGTPCTGLCACELAAHEGSALGDCRNKADPASQAPGYCYVDPAAGLGDPNLVKDCPGTQKRLLRFVGPETPTTGAFAYMACMGSNVQKR